MNPVERLLVLLVCPLLVALHFGSALSAPRSHASPADPSQLAEHRPDELIVRFRKNARPSERAAIRALARGQVLRNFGFIRSEHLQVRGMSVADAIERLRRHPLVEYAEPNYVVRALAVPNDPMFAQMYNLRNTGQTGGTAGADVGATQAWDLHTGDPDIKVGVIDSGVDYRHPDLVANIWTNPGEIPGNHIDDDHNGYVDDVHGYDFANDDGDPMDDAPDPNLPHPPAGHGTHVAGIIAARGNNGLGVVGVCWRARIVAIKFLSAYGYGTHAGALAAIEYAMAVGVRVTNNSWSGPAYTQALFDAINAAGEAGQIFVAAAGNSPNDNDLNPVYPASLESPYIVSVASTDHNDQLSPTSNYGLTSVDLGAPGSDILSTIPVPGPGFAKFSGTSMATPHVAGAVALVLGRFPGMPALQAKDQVLQGVDPVPSLAGKVATGGRLNLFKALEVRDAVPPGAIGDLATLHSGSGTMELSWTATGDDGTEGRATHYEIRYSTGPITEANFAGLPPAPGPAPRSSGTAENAEVVGLAFNTTYNFAIRALDEYGNPGPISNVATGTTLGTPDVSATPASLSQTLLTGATATQSLTVSNDGQGTLDFSVPDLAPAWLGVSPRSGRVLAGQPIQLEARFDALGLAAGRHDAQVRILSNDPDEPSLAIPVELHVTGGPDLAVSPSSLDFDSVFVGWSTTRTLTVSNPGTQDLTVSDITSADPAVTAAPAAFKLAPGAALPVEVTFAPLAPGTLESALTIASDDPDRPAREVALRGRAVPPPMVSAEPESLGATIAVPGTANQTLTIRNGGDSPLVWSLAIAPPPPVSTPSPSPIQATEPLLAAWGSDPHSTVAAASATPPIPANSGPLPALPVVIADPAGDGLPVDLAELRGGGAGMLQVELVLSTPLDPANFFGIVYLDVDRNPSTGRRPLYGYGLPGQDIGAEYEVYVNPTSGIRVYRYIDQYYSQFVGSFAVTIGPRSLRFAIPLWYLGNDDGVMDVTGVIGNNYAATDWFPDNGHGTIPGTNWLAVTPSSGVVGPGQSAAVTVGYDADLLFNGEYSAVLNLDSNDPGKMRVDIPVRLTTIGFPELTVAPPSLDFGSLIVGLTRWIDLHVANDGRAPLIFTPRSASGSGFFFPGANVGYTVQPGDSVTLSIRFAPTAPCSPCMGQITLLTNDEDENPAVVTLAGIGLPAPDIAVSPALVQAGVDPGGTATRTLRIDNPGPGTLEWSGAVALPPDGTPAGSLPPVLDDPVGDAVEFDVLALRGSTVSGLLQVQLDFGTNSIPKSGFLSIDVDRNRSTGARPTQGLYSQDIGAEYEVRFNLLPGSVELYTSTGQLVGSFAANFGSKRLSFSIPLSYLGDEDGAVDVTGVIGTATAPRDWFPNGGHGTIREDVNWLSIDPSHGTIAPAGSAVVQVRFDATSLEGADYLKHLVVSSNDPDEPVVVVPAHLHVAGVPEIRVERRVQSSRSFASRGARTTHDLVVGVLQPAGGMFELVADGNYLHEGYFATLTAENSTFGIVPGTGFTFCRTIRGTFALSVETLAALAADGVVHAAVQNNPDVGPFCVQNRHTLRLQYPISGGTLDFDSVYVGQCAVESLLVIGRGSDTLRVTSVDVTGAELSASPTSFGVATGASRGVVLTWCPTAGGPLEGSITIHSNDPDAPSTTVRVRGIGVVPPGIVVSPPYVVSDLSIPGTTVRMLNIRNDGGSRLDFDARIVSSAGSEAAAASGAFATGPADSPGILSGGPDGFGHRWVDSTEPGGPTFDWVDIARPENLLGLTGQDAISAPVPLGISFPYFGSGYSTAYVTTNGFLMFGSCCAAPSNARLPNAGAPANLIAPFWDALTFTGFSIYAHSDGERFVVSWVGARHRGTPGGPYTFQAILYPDGRIKFQYLTMTPTVSEATVGIQNSTRNDGLTVAHNASYVRSGLAVLIATGGRFVGVLPFSGTVAPGASLDLRLDVSTVFMTPGVLVDTVRISTNVPTSPKPGAAGRTISVPVIINAGTQTDIAAAPSPLDFGTVFIGASSEAIVRARNMGLGILDVTGAQVSGSAFSLVAGGVPSLLGPGEEVALAVRFTPTSACAPCTGSLSISSNDPDENPLAVPLSGIGAPPPDIAVGLDTLRTAGATTLGPLALTRTKPLLVRNTGSSDLVFSTASSPAGGGSIEHAGRMLAAASPGRGREPALDRAGPAFEPARGLPWLSADPGSGTVPPGSSIALDVVFDATGLPAGDHAGNLVISTNDPDEPAVEVPCAFHIGVVPATLRADPHSLMPKSQGRWISASLELGPGLDPLAIALGTLRLQRAVPVDTAGPISYGDFDHDGLLDARYKFDRAELFRHLDEGESVNLEVAGEVRDVTWFQGFDQVKRAPSDPQGARGVVARVDLPREFGLRLDGPCPAPGAVGLELALPRRAEVELRIYDVQGRLVRVLERGEVDPGWNRLAWNGRGDSGVPAPAGVYIAQMAAGGRQFRQRFVLLR